MGRQVSLFDTTLRDGAQTEGVSFSTEDKLEILQRLDAFGIDFVEGGYPGSNPKDKAFFKAAETGRSEALQTGGLRLDPEGRGPGQGRRHHEVAAGSEHRMGMHLRQDLGPARHQGSGGLAGGEPGDRFRHGRFPDPVRASTSSSMRSISSTGGRTTPSTR